MVYEPLTPLHWVPFQDIECPEQRQPRHYPKEMTKNNERVDSLEGFWIQLNQNKVVAIKEIADEGMEGELESHMMKSFIQGNSTFQVQSYPIVQVGGRNPNLTWNFVHSPEVDDILHGHNRGNAH